MTSVVVDFVVVVVGVRVSTCTVVVVGATASTCTVVVVGVIVSTVVVKEELVPGACNSPW